MEKTRTDSQTEFITLLSRHERELSVYVHSLVPTAADAEDIIQMAKLQMWRLFDRYEPGTSFIAWGRKISFYQMLNFRRSEKSRHISVEPDLLESLSNAVSELSGPDESHNLEALRHCLSKLPLDHHRLILLRYFEDADISSLADRIGATAGAVYRSLSRIRMNLLACIEREIANPRQP